MKVLLCTTQKQALARIYNQLCKVSCYEWQLEHSFHKGHDIGWLLLKMPSLEYHVLKVSGTQNVNPGALIFYSQLQPYVSDPVPTVLCPPYHCPEWLYFVPTAMYSALENETYQLHHIHQIFAFWIVHNYEFIVYIWEIRYEAKSLRWKILVCPHKKNSYMSF